MFIGLQVRIVSAHRTPQMMFSYATSAHSRGVQVIIAGAGGAAHLPGIILNSPPLQIVYHKSIGSSEKGVWSLLILGMVASLTPLPVIGVPVRATRLDGVDSLLSIVQVRAPIA